MYDHQTLQLLSEIETLNLQSSGYCEKFANIRPADYFPGSLDVEWKLQIFALLIFFWFTRERERDFIYFVIHEIWLASIGKILWKLFYGWHGGSHVLVSFLYPLYLNHLVADWPLSLEMLEVDWPIHIAQNQLYIAIIGFEFAQMFIKIVNILRHSEGRAGVRGGARRAVSLTSELFPQKNEFGVFSSDLSDFLGRWAIILIVPC